MALLILSGCAGSGAAAREDVDGLRAEVRALRLHGEAIERRLERLSGELDVVSARLARAAPPRSDASPAAAPAPAPAPAPVIPPDLAVVRIGPPQDAPAPEAPPVRRTTRTRTPPPVPISIPISEPDPEQLAALARPTGRELSAEAAAALRAARRRSGLPRAHALEDFTARYPRHPAADNALLDAAEAYGAAGHQDAACALARRAADEYPAGDAMSGALERLAACEARSGATEPERRLLERLVAEYPSTPAAARAGARLTTISGSDGETSPRTLPARSGP